MNLQLPILSCLTLLSISTYGAGPLLSAKSAKLIGPNIKMEQGTQIAYWKVGESAEWAFTSAQNSEQDLVIDYSSIKPVTISVVLDGVKISDVELKGTKDFKKYVHASLGNFSLNNGAHTLRLTAVKGGVFCLNVRSAQFSDAIGTPIQSASSPDLILPAVNAKRIGKNIKMQDGKQLAFWKVGESAEWTFTVAQDAEQSLYIDCASFNASTLSVWLDGKKILEPSLSETKNWNKYSEILLGKVLLKKGTHTLRLTAVTGAEYCFNLRKVTFTSATTKPVMTPEKKSVPSGGKSNIVG